MVASDEFRRVFGSFDQDGDGKISATELRLCVKASLGEDMPEDEVQALMASADTDGDGLLDEEEFVRLVTEMEADDDEEEDDDEKCRCLREAFAMYEMEGRRCITPLSLKLMLNKLGTHLDVAECQAMICRFDMNGDGVLTFDDDTDLTRHNAQQRHASSPPPLPLPSRFPHLSYTRADVYTVYLAGPVAAFEI
uniref:EF-hand domain-containing protein n=1 Tax=Oryza meridionalis TaxID=40149 RepID=A0A0E0CD40_9ORYZ